MKHGAKIYLGSFNEPLEINEDFDLNMNFNFADTQEPTAVKNSWSRTVHLPATKINNRILGNIYANTWIAGEDNFNPNKRTDFNLYIDGILKMTGYAQLNTVNRDSRGIYGYELTFYGGLGDFFYNLATDEETGEAKKLSDLIWGVKDEYGNAIPPKDEFNFKINKEFVWNNWQHLNNNIEDGTINDFISFAPIYEGAPSSISADKVLINTNGDDTYDSISGKTYNGYVMAELSGKTDEWCTRDLRSYLQRPVVKISKLMEAIADKRNNGGYEVNFDPTFFNKNNPYYGKAWLTLPLLTIPDEDTGESLKTETSIDGGQLSRLGGTTAPTSSTLNIQYRATDNFTADGNYIDFSAFTGRTGFKTTVQGEVIFRPSNTALTQNYDELYLNLGYQFVNVGDGEYHERATAIGIDFDLYDGQNKKIGNRKATIIDSYPTEMQITNAVIGKFIKQTDGSYKYSVPFNFSITVQGKDTDKIRAEMNATKLAYLYDNVNQGLGVVIEPQNPDEEKQFVWFDGVFSLSLTKGILKVNAKNQISSDTPIDKKILFNSENENSVLDFLLSYTKRFGIVWTKSKTEKKIYAWKRDTFYKRGADIILEDYIDYNQETKIKPLNFDYRFYAFRDVENGNYYSQMYKKKYGKEYGQKRADTNYAFNDDTSEMTANSIFQSIPEVNVNAIYNRNWFMDNGNNIGSWVYLYKGNLTTYDTSTEQTRNINFNLADKLGRYAWYAQRNGDDWIHRPSCAADENGTGSLDYALLFYNGATVPKDNGGDTIPYYLTDDVDEMYVLNDAKPTFLQTNSEYDKANNKIAYNLVQLPYFSRWITENNSVKESWDWGTPAELYVRGIVQGEDINLYGKFWKNYLGDQFSVNSRTLTCHVDLRKMTPEWMALGNRFYFENSVWVLSEVNDYNEMTEDTTECVFIKVLDLNNYTDGQMTTE